MLHFCDGHNYKPVLLGYGIMETINWNFYDVCMYDWLCKFLCIYYNFTGKKGILDLQLHAMYIPDGPKTALD